MAAVAKLLPRTLSVSCKQDWRLIPIRKINTSSYPALKKLQENSMERFKVLSLEELKEESACNLTSENLAQVLKEFKQQPHQVQTNITKVYQQYFDLCKNLDMHQRVAAVSQLLSQLEDQQLLLDASSASQLIETLAGTEWNVQKTTLDAHSGECQCCGAVVKKSIITDKWFDLLKTAFVEKVVLPGEVYVKSTPVEWQRFNTFLASELPFTHVMDAASVAGSGFLTNPYLEPIKAPKYVLSAVKQIKAAHPKSKLLVVCREFMKQWDKDAMKELPDLATVYYRQTAAEDDAYFLYAAMLSGAHCKFITRSHLKQHQYALDSVELQGMFRLWQQQSQQSLQLPLFTSDPPVVMRPMEYNSSRLTLGEHIWHLPYDDGSLQVSYRQPDTWLCAQHASVAGDAQPATASATAPATAPATATATATARATSC